MTTNDDPDVRRETIAYDAAGNRLTPDLPPRPVNTPPSAQETAQIAVDPLREALEEATAGLIAIQKFLEHGERIDGDVVLRWCNAATAALAAAPQPDEMLAWAAKVILSQPKRPDSPVAGAFAVACAHLEDRECGAETTNEIIETFLKALAGEDN